jgi:hypothetical protein
LTSTLVRVGKKSNADFKPSFSPTQGLAPTTDRHAGETREQREAGRKKEVEKGRMFDLTYDKLIVTVSIPGYKVVEALTLCPFLPLMNLLIIYRVRRSYPAKRIILL